MTAGNERITPESLILLAPGAIIKEATQGGHFFGNSFDPANPPEDIKCFHHFKLGRDYLVQTQSLDAITLQKTKMKITINDGNVSPKTNTTATFFDYIFILNKLNQAQVDPNLFGEATVRLSYYFPYDRKFKKNLRPICWDLLNYIYTSANKTISDIEKKVATKLSNGDDW